jgi:phosphoribosyl 1,2-cyclic phosphate phosphodiesterase
VIGCGCATCTSTDPRDKRTRHAVLLEEGERRILVDTPPELRLQLVAAGVRHLDAVWYTHCHADHVHGVDDLRAFSLLRGDVLPVYASEECTGTLMDRFGYVFDADVRPVEGTSKPEARLHAFRAFERIDVAGFDMLPIAVPHGLVQAYGFRVGGLGYITDAKSLPRDAFDALRGVRTLVLNALWYGDPHPTHFTVEEAVEAAQAVGAERTYLTHLTHRVSHAELERRLPEGIHPSYDGLVVEVD